MTNDNITAGELFQRIAHIAATGGASAPKAMHDVLVLACAYGLRGTRHGFGNLMSQVDALCREHHLSAPQRVAIHQMRRHSNQATLPLGQGDLLADCRALALFVQAVFKTAIPGKLDALLPRQLAKPHARTDRQWPCLRCVVRGWDDSTVTVSTDSDDDGQMLVVHYVGADSFYDLSYLSRIFHEGMQLNLIDCRADGSSAQARWIVVEPDYLMDISTLASCFCEYGHHALAYLVQRMKPGVNTQPILLGNFAGDALDALVHGERFSFADTLNVHFRDKALEYATCPGLNLEQLKKDMLAQVGHLQEMVDALFSGQQDNPYSRVTRDEAILEPSFVCESLGLRGRVDLMTSDKRLLVEQKSGKNIWIERGQRNAFGGQYLESHYVQVLLYHGVLRYNFNLAKDHARIFLMYSRYDTAHGLLEMPLLQKLLAEAIKFRNQAVATEFYAADKGFQALLPALKPQTLATQHLDSVLVTHYMLPQLHTLLDPLQQLKPVMRAYLCRMMTFVMKEQLMQRVGAQEGNGNAEADLWNMPLEEKREAGNIYTGLTIIEEKCSSAYSGYDTLTLRVPRQGDDFLPNFRRGDMVYLYRYAVGLEPDARRAILFRGTLADIASTRITVVLNEGQHTPGIFRPFRSSGHTQDSRQRREAYAIERCATDSGRGIQALYQLATAPERRQLLLLDGRAPEADTSLALTRPYHPDYDEVLLRVRQAKDYFLLIGPPGTGKTSMALRFMVQEALEQPGATLLLMSYTNRAVDEISAMLCDAHIDFLRLGSALRADDAFRPYLVSEAVSADPSLEGIRHRLHEARVIVSTTSTLAARQEVFALKHFSLAIIDEASQILEPDIIGLLAAHGSDARPCIDRFVLVGDYKQLPAVVQQDAAETLVHDALLQGIGLVDCRQSLFERLIRNERRHGRTAFTGILRKQGRMHPELAEFPNRMFYFHEHLQPVPCPHQLDTSLQYDAPSADALDDALKQHRILFIPSDEPRQDGVSEKANRQEARIVADVLRRIHRFYGPRFDASRTVGVIVPYRNQIAMIRRELEALHLPGLSQVSIDTVERYQGSQRDVIVYSFTIHSRYQLDFLTANSFEEDGRVIDRKLNVALTRAKKQLVLTGNVPLLRTNAVFNTLIDFIRDAGGYTQWTPGEEDAG